MWKWPLNAMPVMPGAHGSFGAVRTYDVHTGVDLYCELGTDVVAVEDGEVISIEKFTGPNADDPSPWWNDTYAILVRGASGVILYGEVEPRVKVGDQLTRGQVIASVETPVIKRYKGRPMVMLHFELMTSDATKSQWWKLGEEKPEVLLDPTRHLKWAALSAAGDAIFECETPLTFSITNDGPNLSSLPGIEIFSLDTYDGVRFREKQED